MSSMVWGCENFLMVLTLFGRGQIPSESTV